jgi:hypothetical protein
MIARLKRTALAIAVAAATSAGLAPAFAQTQGAQSQGAQSQGAQAQAASAPPRTSWGAPDLQGVWTNSSITRLTRPEGVASLVLTPEQAKALEDKDFNNVRTREELRPTDQTTGAPEKGKALPPVGNYNAVWVDPGSRVAVVRGQLRSSFITDPPNGRIPMSDAALRGVGTSTDAAARSYEGPESRSVGERCLIGFGGSGGPVMSPVLYNNHYQFVQSPDHVVIVVEMVHDARIIPIEGSHGPAGIPKWLGDSVGRWEGDTLVVETRNVHPQQIGPVFISDTGRLVERFTRVSSDEILYQFEVNDPAIYTQVWRGEMPLNASREQVYEYACHEGNYGLYNILEGARMQEKRGGTLELTADDESGTRSAR